MKLKSISTPVFLSAGEWRDLRGKNVLYFYGISAKLGRVEIIVDNQQPLFFIPREASLPPNFPVARRATVDLTDFDGRPVDALYFNGQRELRRGAEMIADSGGRSYEADIQPERRFLMERFINAQAEISGPAYFDGSYWCFRNPTFVPADSEPVFRVASLDIETGVDSGELYSIAVSVSEADRKTVVERVFMLADRSAKIDDTLSYYPDEKSLLQAFLEWFAEIDPDIIIGWNVVGFDLLFLDEKCQALGLKFTLGRRDVPIHLYKRRRGSGYSIHIAGRVVIDGPPALRGAFYTYEDFRLETVAQALLGIGKTITSDKDKIAEIDRQFREDKPALAEYNLQDCRLVTQIFSKLELLKLYVRRAQISGMLMSDVGRSVAAFDHFYLPHLHRHGMVAPNVADIQPQGHAAGGYVMKPQPGIYDDVIVLDFKSLYPSIIQSYKIEPYSRLKADVNPLKTPDGFVFSATENFMPDFISRLMEQRLQAKKNNDGALSQAIKILMNSFYGVVGAFGCRFYHPELPSAITGTGQWLLKGTRRYLESKGYTVLYGDTDSVFVHLKPEDMEKMPERGHQLASDLNRYWNDRLAEEGIESHLEMEFEKHFHRFVLPLARAVGGGARKRYAGLVGAGESERLLFIGMEYVRSDWTPLAKQFQYDLYWRILHNQPVKRWLRRLVKEIFAGEHDARLVYRKKLRKDPQEYTKNISPQVRAALMLDKPVREVHYLMTIGGPVPLEKDPRQIDYRHYVDKQLRPIADSVLGLMGTSFDAIIHPEQLKLF